MTTSRGFTLVEVTIALVVTGLVVTMAYGAAQAGLETGERAATHQATREGAYVTRAMIADALRHAVPGVRGGSDVFTLHDRVTPEGVAADSLEFRSRGLVAPFGTGDAWRVTVWGDGSSLRMVASPSDAGAPPPVRARVAAGGGFDVRVLGHDGRDDWRTRWNEGDITPDAVSFDLSDADGAPPLRTVVRVGLERRP